MTHQASHEDTLQYALDGAVLTATLPLSSDGLLSLRACDELAQLLSSPPEAASVVVLTSDRPQFCLGRERTAASVDELPSEVDRLVAVNCALRSTRLVSVARVHGDAAGFGVGLAALSDFAVASSDASFWFPEINIDLAPFLVLAWLPQLVGRREALHLAVTGESINAHRAGNRYRQRSRTGSGTGRPGHRDHRRSATAKPAGPGRDSRLPARHRSGT